MTITTVGYDVNLNVNICHVNHSDKFQTILQTLPGHLVGTMCAVVGVFAMTLPLPIVVNSFSDMYNNQMWRNEVGHKKKMRWKEGSRKISDVNQKLIEATKKLRQVNTRTISDLWAITRS